MQPMITNKTNTEDYSQLAGDRIGHAYKNRLGALAARLLAASKCPAIADEAGS